jgi:uncharacterized protein YcbX
MQSDLPDMPRVLELAVYPLKGARAVPLRQMVLDQIGAVGDRRWMVVDGNDVVLTPRDVPRLAQVVAAPRTDAHGVIDVSTLTMQCANEPALVVTQRDDASTRVVRCWDDDMLVAETDDVADAWLTRVLGRACRLVHMIPATHRPLAAKYTGGLPHETRGVAATDGAPLLVLGTGSLTALNSRLAQAGLPAMDPRRFRANVLLSDLAAHEEDRWSRIRIGDVEIGIGTPCPRCVVTTIDPETLERGPEPLRMLATYRRVESGQVMFGMNATHAAPGTLRLQDTVTVLHSKPPA